MSIRTSNIQAIIDSLKGSAPANLDTLQEVAAALNNDPQALQKVSTDPIPQQFMLMG